MAKYNAKPLKLNFHYNKDNSITINCQGKKLYRFKNRGCHPSSESANAFATGWFGTSDKEEWNYVYTYAD